MKVRYRSMDTLRSVAILIVVLAHSVLSYGAPSFLAPLQLGGVGVDLFFVLSGWLLGSQLFKEALNTSTIDVKKFWVRRWFRTLPAYFAVLSASVIQRYLTKENVDFPLEYFFFIQNYDFPLEFFSVSWSLCVEEQFYLVIAPLLLFLSKLSRFVSLAALCVILIVPSVFRVLGWFEYSEETHVRMDGCIAGVIIAQIRYCFQGVWDRFAVISRACFLPSCCLFVCFFIARYQGWEEWLQNPSPLVLAVVFSIWVIFANSSAQILNRFYFPGAHYIATRSYALYLLHPESLALMARYFKDTPFIIYFVLTVLISLILSEVLFRLVEKPFMDMRERISIAKDSR